MADNTPIEWTDATWNIVTGCSVLTPGCTHCYAMRLAGSRLAQHPSRKGLTRDSKAGPVWTGEVRFNEQWLMQPLQWKRPRRIFVCAHADLFHENVPVEWIDKVFAVMALASQHTFQVLTKRSARMREYMKPYDSRRADALGQAVIKLGYRDPLECQRFPLPNVWMGVSVEDQKRADERIPDLLSTPAAIRWISAEPLLGPVDLHEVIPNPLGWNFAHGFNGLDWVVAGGESGPGARPSHPDWYRSLRDQCAAAGVAFNFKQHGDWKGLALDDGEWPTDAGSLIRLTINGNRADSGWPMQRVGKKFAGRLLDGIEHNGFPHARDAALKEIGQ